MKWYYNQEELTERISIEVRDIAYEKKLRFFSLAMVYTQYAAGVAIATTTWKYHDLMPGTLSFMLGAAVIMVISFGYMLHEHMRIAIALVRLLQKRHHTKNEPAQVN